MSQACPDRFSGSLVTSIEEQGYWWLPGGTENRVPGRLDFKSGDFKLALAGTFGREPDITEVLSMEPIRLPIILGTLQSGRACTLLDTQMILSGFRASPHLMVETMVYPTFALIGRHFERAAEVNFKSWYAQFSHLEDWLQHTGVEKRIIDPGNKQEIRIECSYAWPEELKFELPWGSVSFPASWTFPHLPMNEIHFVERMAAHLELYEPASIQDVLVRVISPLADFLSFAMAKPAALLDLQSRLDSEPDDRPERPISVVYRLSRTGEISSKELFAPEMLLPFQSIREEFASYLTRWFELYDSLDDVMSNFWAAIGADDLHVQFKFQTIIAALEALHCRTSKSSASLREVLSERCGPIFRLLNADELICERLVERIKDTRHYYAHYSDKLLPARLEPLELLRASELLKWSFCYAILRMLGMTEEQRDSRLKKCQGFLQFGSDWNELVSSLGANE